MFTQLPIGGGHVYNFTTINIASGSTLKLSGQIFPYPLYFLAQGAVTISGTLDLSGDSGQSLTNVATLRIPAAGGPGGYSGGVGGNTAGSYMAESGNGSGGGSAATALTTPANDGKFTGSPYLIPLIGGSGGGGGLSNAFVWSGCATNCFGGSGGGGGGAILIASSVSITYSGFINASGGAPGSGFGTPGGTIGQGGSGSSGAIRLVAPTISQTRGGDGPCLNGGTLAAAVQRIEAFNFTSDPSLGNCVTVKTSNPINVVTPSIPPSALKVVSLVTSSGTIPINANPFSFPDAVINTSSPVTVNVQAQYIPTGTVPKIIVFSDSGAADQSVLCSAGLQGTLAQSTCSASITFAIGGNRGFVKATWNQ